MLLNYFWVAPCLLFSSQTPGSDETQQLQKALLDYLDENIDKDTSLVVSVSFYIHMHSHTYSLCSIPQNVHCLSICMYLFHPVCKEVLHRSVVQGHNNWGRQSDEVSKWERRWLERSFQGWWFNCWNYAEGWSTKEIPPQDKDFTITFQFSDVNTTSLCITALICYAVHLLTYPNCLLHFSFRSNSDTVDYEDSCLIVRYLASMRPFAQSFDIYLSQVLFISHEVWEIRLCCLAVSNLFSLCVFLYRFWEFWVRVLLQSELKPWSVCLR